jgi:hypothetical protein
VIFEFYRGGALAASSDEVRVHEGPSRSIFKVSGCVELSRPAEVDITAGHWQGVQATSRGRENEARRVAIYSRPAIGWAQARRDRRNGGATENVIGEFGLFADEGASSERERAAPKSPED